MAGENAIAVVVAVVLLLAIVGGSCWLSRRQRTREVVLLPSAAPPPLAIDGNSPVGAVYGSQLMHLGNPDVHRDARPKRGVESTFLLRHPVPL